MDNEQILLNLYKQQQYNETHSIVQRVFMYASLMANIIGLVIMSVYFVNWPYVLVFAGTVVYIAVILLLEWRKVLKLHVACYLVMIFAAFVFVPVFWIMIGINGSPYVVFIILVSIIALFRGKMLKWMLTGFMLELAGLLLYSALTEFLDPAYIYTLTYTVVAYIVAAGLIVLYMLYKQREFDKLNDRFLRASFKDELTQLYNRKLLDLILEYQESLYTRERKDYILVMFDIDDFKALNDEHGHMFGDVVLRNVAECIKDATRKADFVVRYGGDEFLVIQTNASQPSVQNFLNRINEKMKTYCKMYVDINVSFGYALRSECDMPKTVLKLADERLYKQKAEKKTNR